MPRDPALAMSAPVAASTSGDVVVLLEAEVTGGGPVLALAASVSTARRQAVTGNVSAHRVEIWLAGQRVSDDDLVGDVSLTDELDTPNVTLRFRLRGLPHSIASTLRTWTLVPVDAVAYDCDLSGGVPSPVISRLVFRGALVAGAGSQSAARYEPEIELTADTAALLPDKVCFEVEPGAGLTRAQIADQAIDGVPVVAPGGPVFTRGVSAANQTAAAWLKDFGTAPGWHWRFAPDGSGVCLEAYTAGVSGPPVPPTETWTAGECISIDLEPPAEPLSTVYARGVRTVTSLDELGTEVTVRTLEVKGPYAPLVAVQEQLTSGAIVSVSGSSQEADRVIRRLETETHVRAGLEKQVVTREWGFYNPPAAVLRTPSGGESPGPESGYYRTRAWIDEGGEARVWRRERFVQVSERRVVSTHQGAQLTGKTVEDYRHFRRTSGVKVVDGGVPGSWVTSAAVGTDDQSYHVTRSAGGRLCIAEYALAERLVITPRYDPEGTETGRQEQRYSYYSPRAAVDVDGLFVRYDDTAQADIVANWRLTSETEIAKGLTDDLRLLSELSSERRYHALIKHQGLHDWGGGERSNRVSESYRTVETQLTLYNRRGDGSAEVIRIGEDGSATEEIRDVAIPLPRFDDSPWTLTAEEHLEHIVSDPLAAALWGEASEVLESPYITSEAEAQAAAETIMRRRGAARVRIVRPESLARVGSTFRLVDPHQDLDHRVLITQRSSTFTPRTGAWMVEYRGEVSLL